MSDMKQPRIDKVVVNIGVGEAGERLNKALKVLNMVTQQKPVVTTAKVTNRDLGVRSGMPIGCKVTMRGERAQEFLRKALSIRDNRVAMYSFDKEGNLSFGLPDYTDFEGMKYDPRSYLRHGRERGLHEAWVPGRKRRIMSRKIPHEQPV
jgi:large subunit ribosomal protein L5